MERVEVVWAWMVVDEGVGEERELSEVVFGWVGRLEDDWQSRWWRKDECGGGGDPLICPRYP